MQHVMNKQKALQEIQLQQTDEIVLIAQSIGFMIEQSQLNLITKRAETRKLRFVCVHCLSADMD